MMTTNKKYKKTTLSLLLAVIMLLSNIVGYLPSLTALTAKAATQGKFTVYFQQPTGWDSPNIYFFQDNNTNMTTWPGVAMEWYHAEDGNDWYRKEFTNQSYIKAVFYGGGDKQCPARFESLYVDRDIWVYSDGSTTYADPFPSSEFDIDVMFQKPNGWGTPNAYFYNNLGTPNQWPGKQMKNLGDGWYEAEETSSVDAKVLFNNNNNTGQQIPGQNIEGFEVKKGERAWFYSDGKKASANPRSNTKGIKVYFQKPNNWGNPSIYYYQDGRSELSWPGVAMKDEGDGWFSYNIVTKEKPQVVFNCNGGTTQYPAQNKEGILVECNKWFYSDYSEASANPRGNDHPIRVHFKKPSNWGNNVWLYFYQDGRHDYAWPGVAMKNEGNGWYYYDITTKQAPQVIFNDNNGNQISPYMVEGDKVLYTETWFMNENNKLKQYAEDPEPPTKTITIHFEKPDNWNKAFIWYNSDSTKSKWETTVLAEKPGDMFEYRTGWYKKDILIHDDATAQFLFNDGTWNKKVDAGGSDFFASRNVWISKNGVLHNEDPVRYSEAKRFYGIQGGYAPTGNYSQSFTDLTVSSVLGDLSLTRVYNSMESSNDSMFGKGFHFNYNMRIAETPSMTYVVMPDSEWISFQKQGNNYKAIDGRGTLTKDTSSGKFTYITLDQMQYDFNAANYLISIKDRNDNIININRNSSNQIETMTDTAGMSVSFNYSGNKGIVSRITDNKSNRAVYYGYNPSNCFTSVTYDSGIKTMYEYNNSNVLNKIIASPRINSDTSAQTKALLTYDGGLVKTITDEQGLVSTYDYTQTNSKQVKITDEKAITTLKYNNSLDITEIKTAHKDTPTVDADVSKALYSEFHEITESIDVSGNKTQYTYDLQGNITKIRQQDDTIEEYAYDKDNNRTSFTDKTGLITSYAYDARGNLLSETRPLKDENNVIINHVINQYEYHPQGVYPINGLLKKTIGVLGDNDNCTEYTYSFPSTGSVDKTVTTTKKVNGSPYSSVTEYNKAGQITKESTYTGIATINIFDAAGFLTDTEIRDNGTLQETTHYKYNGLGQETETSVTYAGRNPIVTESKYDEKGNLKTEIEADGTITEYDYDSYGNVKKEIEKDSIGIELVTTTTKYDELNRATEEKEVDNKNGNTDTTKTDYGFVTDQPLNIIDPLTNTITDKNGGITITKSTDEYGKNTITETGFDGRLLKQTNPNGLVQINTYTAEGLLAREVYQVNGSTQRWTGYKYDGWGRLTEQTGSFKSTTNTNFSETKYTYDKAGNVLTTLTKVEDKVEETKYQKISYEYDKWGNKTRETTYDNFFDANGNVIGTLKEIHHDTEYTWDGLISKDRGMTYTYDNTTRQLTKNTDAMGKDEKYSYDCAGRLIETIDRKGIVHTVEYDDLGRASKETSGTIMKTNTYNEEGKLKSVTEVNNGVSTMVSYKYDGMGNVIEEKSGNITKTILETQNETTRLREVVCTISNSNNNLQKTKQVYNPYGQLEKVYKILNSGTAVLQAEYTYNLFGQVLTTTYGNGTTETNDYNAAGLTTSTQNKPMSTAHPNLSEYTYSYYYNGSQEEKTDEAGTTDYFYDGRGQLTKTEMSNGAVQDYTFDDNGNRLTMKETPSNNGTAVTTTYTYDANDRLTTETKAGLITYYTYDVNGNQVSKATNASSTSQTHEFDALNRMTCFYDGAKNTIYTYYPDNMRKSKKTGNNEAITHIWMDDEIALDMTGDNVVSYIHGLKLIVSDYGWYHYNAHGDVVQLSDDNGVLKQDYDYDPYGNIIKSTSGTDNNPYRYCGEYFDTESGYTYLRARYYDPNIGRFISEDPALDGINWYAYCWNDPVNKIDPSGHKIELSGGATTRQKEEYKRAIKYLKTSNKGKKLINKLKKSDKVITIKFVDNIDANYYNAEYRTIYWDVGRGLTMINGKSVMSPALLLAHEMGHAAQHLDGELDSFIKNKTPSKLEKIEAENLKKHETPIAKQLGEPTRSSYTAHKGERRMNNSIHHIIIRTRGFFWSYTVHRNQFPMVGDYFIRAAK